MTLERVPMLIVCSSLIVFAAVICYYCMVWTRKQQRQDQEAQSELALEGIKRVKAVQRGASTPTLLRSRNKPTKALAATATTAHVNPVAREIAAALAKKQDPNGPWQRGLRTY